VESNVYVIKEPFLDRAIKIAEGQRINCEPSGIAGLALLLQMKHKIPQNKKILIVNTGKTRFP
jgi:threonine dehydratase